MQTPKTSNAVDNVRHSTIVNEKLEKGKNYLHILIEHLSPDNYYAIFEMIKIMIINRCSPNSPNDQLETPFYLLLKKQKEIKCESDLINFFIQHSSVDIYSHKSDEIIKLLEEQDLLNKIVASQTSAVKDVNFMTQQLEQWNEKKFFEEFASFCLQSQSTNDFQSDLAKLLEAATARNFTNIVALLLNNGAQVNGIPQNSRFNLAPAFLACYFGHHQLLKVLLKDQSLNFKCRRAQRNLLHQICLSKNIHASDRLKCFDLIAADRRCTLEIINELDGADQTPLYYACHNGFDEIAKELLRRGAFVGHESTINGMDKDVFKEFLDECIKCPGEVNDKSTVIHLDYRFLMSPNLHEKSHLEIEPLHSIADNHKLKDLILHPAISSFLGIKWSKISFLVHFNILLYFCFMIYLGVFVLKYFHHPVFNSYNFENDNSTSILDNRIGDVDNNGNDFSNSFDEKQMHDENSIGRHNGVASDTLSDADNVQSSGEGAFGPPVSGFAPAFAPPSHVIVPVPIPVPVSPKRMHSHKHSHKHARKPDMFSSLFFGFGKEPEKRVKRSIDNDSDWNQQFEDHYLEQINAYRFCVFGVFLMAVYEIIQFIMSYRRYFFKLSNWLDLILIYLSYVVLLKPFDNSPDYFKHIRAFTILVMAAQTIQLVAKVSILSMSLHMAIFKRVCATFLKTTALYLIMILAFAMSFYTLNEDGKESDDLSIKTYKEEDKMGFANPFMSIITTVRMMLADFDNFQIADNDFFQGLILLLFIILITVVLFNLLNALAIRDTNEILTDAELVEKKKRISILYTYEKLFKFFNLRFADILPEMSTIVISPNKDNVIRVKRSFSTNNDVKILMTKPGKIEKFIDTSKLIFWRKDKDVMRMSNKSIQKIFNFVKDQKQSKVF